MGDSGRHTRIVAVLLAAAVAAFGALVAWCAWWGLRFSLAGPSGMRLVVTGRLSGPVRLLSGLLGGVSGPLLLGSLTAAAAAALGLGGDRSGGATAAARLRRWWRDLVALSRDTAGWLRGLPERAGGWHAAALAVVVLAGMAIRALYLTGPVSYDEAFTFTHFTVLPPELGLSRYTYPNNHLLHTLLAHWTTGALGSAPWAMRLPAFLAGAAAVPAAYAAWDALGEQGEALVATAVTAAAGPTVVYSTQARGYALVLLFGLLLVPLAARLRRRRDRAAWTGFVVLAAASLHAIPAALYPAGAVFAWLLLGERPGLRKEAAVAAALTALAVAWLYQPPVQRTGVPAVVANRFVAPSPLAEFAAALPGFFADLWSAWTAGLPRAVAAALGALGALGLARDAWAVVGTDVAGRGPSGSASGAASGLGPRAGASFTLVALGWFLLVLAASRKVPFPRVWLFLLPVFGLWVARGGAVAARTAGRLAGGRWAAALRSRLAAPVAAVLLLAGIGGPVVAAGAVEAAPGPDPFRSGREVARALEERMEEGEAVLAYGTAEVVLEYWFEHLGIPRARINAYAEAGEPLYAVVHRAEGQTLADLLTRAGVAGVRRTLAEEVAAFEGATLYVLPAPVPESGGASPGGRPGERGRP